MNKLYVIGNPIRHSKSPAIHNYWINKYELGLEYKKMEVERELLPSLIQNVRDKKITGLNITLPYKKDIISYIDEVSYSAKDIGAINNIPALCFEKHCLLCLFWPPGSASVFSLKAEAQRKMRGDVTF